MDRALADYMDIQCYGERKRARLGLNRPVDLVVVWPELCNKLPQAARSL